MELSKTIHGYFRCSGNKLEQPGLHFIIKILHSLPEPDDDIVIGGVAISINRVLTPVINTDLSKTTKKVLEGREGGGEERERERDE